MIINKKGLTFATIVGFIVLIIGFAIVIYFYFTIGWGERIDKDTCASSVVLKAGTPDISGKKIIDFPLRCKTEKICITEKDTLQGGGNCKDYTESESVAYEKVSSDSEIQVREIHQIIANAMADCWGMMGKGEFAKKDTSIFSKDLLGVKTENLLVSGKTYQQVCVRCSRISFSEEIKEKYKRAPRIPGIYWFLNGVKVPGKDFTYLNYLTNNRGPNVNPLSTQNDFLNMQSEYSIVFSEFHLNTDLQTLGAFAGGIAGAIFGLKVPVLGSTGTAAGGAWLGSKGGSWVMTLLNQQGAKVVSTWSFLPSMSGRTFEPNGVFSKVNVPTRENRPKGVGDSQVRNNLDAQHCWAEIDKTSSSIIPADVRSALGSYSHVEFDLSGTDQYDNSGDSSIQESNAGLFVICGGMNLQYNRAKQHSDCFTIEEFVTGNLRYSGSSSSPPVITDSTLQNSVRTWLQNMESELGALCFSYEDMGCGKIMGLA
ncbi:MAG: hypothetical protein KKF56_03970 [Nanoarchaeota archaeon]|nr:hypothetical protein [Nanoarchaeota archaeon]